VGADGEIFAVNATGGGVDQLVRLPRNAGCPPDALESSNGCLPGGYGDLQVIDDDVSDAELLADVKFVPFTFKPDNGEAVFEAGDVMVRSESTEDFKICGP
jgi:hypothetical protein